MLTLHAVRREIVHLPHLANFTTIEVGAVRWKSYLALSSGQLHRVITPWHSTYRPQSVHLSPEP